MTPRTAQIRAMRVTPAVHDWLLAMSDQTGLSTGALVNALLDHARTSGWTVKPAEVQVQEGTP